MNRLDDIGGRSPQGIGDQLDFVVGEGALDLGQRGGEGPAQQTIGLFFLGEFGDARVAQQLGGEIPVLLGHRCAQLRFELVGIHFAHALVLARDDGIDPVGLVADTLIDPLQFGFELLDGEAYGAQDPKTACLADLDDDVPAMGECKNWNVDSKPVA